MKKLVLKLTPEQEEGIYKALGIEHPQDCGFLQVVLDEKDIELIKSGRKTEVLVYLLPPEIPDDPVFVV